MSSSGAHIRLSLGSVRKNVDILAIETSSDYKDIKTSSTGQVPKSINSTVTILVALYFHLPNPL
jgi:hypothetical protein